MSDEDFVTRDDAGARLCEANFVCGQLAVVRHRLRTRVNDLSKTVEERKALLAALKADEEALMAKLDQLSTHLTPADAALMQEQKALL